jgi:hypothetical protein
MVYTARHKLITLNFWYASLTLLGNKGSATSIFSKSRKLNEILSLLILPLLRNLSIPNIEVLVLVDRVVLCLFAMIHQFRELGVQFLQLRQISLSSRIRNVSIIIEQYLPFPPS